MGRIKRKKERESAKGGEREREREEGRKKREGGERTNLLLNRELEHSLFELCLERLGIERSRKVEGSMEGLPQDSLVDEEVPSSGFDET